MLNEINTIQASADLLYNEADIKNAIVIMAEKINALLSDRNPVILCVMNGGVVVTGQLLPLLQFPLTFDAINASRYRNQLSGSQIEWIQKPETNLYNRTVLIVDDILDEGTTLEAIRRYCHDKGASSVYTAVLIDKKIKLPKPIIADFIGLEIEDRYVFGYGMDYKGYLRNAAGIFACKEIT